MKRLVAGGAAAIALAIAGVLTLRGDDEVGLAALSTNSVAVIDPTGTLRAQMEFNGRPGHVAAAGDAIWVADDDRGTVSRLDPKTYSIRQTIRVGHGSSAVAADRDGVWVANRQDGKLLQIAAATNEIVTRVDVGGAPSDVCLAGGSVWVASPAARRLLRVDPGTGKYRPVPLEVQPERLACGEGAVWASSEADGRVVQIDPRAGRAVRTIDVGVGAGALATGAGVWVANPLRGTVSRIDPERGVVTATVPVGKDDEPSEIAVGAGGIWVANRQASSLARIPATGTAVDRKLELKNAPQGLAVVGGALWVSVTDGGTTHRGGTLRQVSPSVITTVELDPAVTYGDSGFSAVYDGLMVIRSFGMPGQPIPNLAAALPEVTDGGITYTFTIRRGIRFSDGRPLRPSDVAYSLNRSLKGPLGGQLLNTLSRSDADDGAGTVTLHLARPDPEFLYKLATPPAVVLPRGSGNPPADRPLPGTGPYRIAQFSSGRRFRLERNPYFKVWSAAARPDGYPDAISVERVKSVEEGVGAVSSGAADHLAMPLLAQSTKLLPDLRRRFGDRLHTSVPAGVQWVWMNFDFPPFNRLAARQAVQVALDRQAVLRQQGGTAGARLTCRIIPPGLAGHEAEPCPYPERPDLAKARRLVRASGTRGMRVTVLTGAPDFTTLGRLLGRTLDSIGYRATVRTLPIGDFFTLLARPRHDGNIGPFGWFADYPAPSNFFLPLFTCGRPPLNTNPGHFCDRGLDALMRRAQRLQAGQPVEANRLWAEVDRRLVEQAAVLPLTNGVVHDFVSERVGNYQTGAFGVRAEQLWVR